MRHQSFSNEALCAVARKSVRRMPLFAAILCCLLPAAARAQDAVTKSVNTLEIGATKVTVNVYERAGAAVTLFAPHHNEEGARKAALAAVAAHGGRFVEVVSFKGRAPSRYLSLRVGAKEYIVDPNRIYTDNGRKYTLHDGRCLERPRDAVDAMKALADKLLALLFVDDGKRLRQGESLFVAVHNNGDVEKADNRDSDLSAVAFVKPLRSRATFPGAFEESAAGVYLSNTEEDEDNFIIVTEPRLLSPFAARGFNVIVQKAAPQLRAPGCSLDDGSLSVHAAFNNIPYLNLEADIVGGAARQRQMLEAVYDFIKTRQ